MRSAARQAEDGDFNVGFKLAMQALLLDAEFIYLVERGEPVGGDSSVLRLGDFEMASRLSFLLWGSAPDDALLDLAEAGELETAKEIHDAATTLLADPRGLEQVQRLHAMWLSYDNLAVTPALADSMRKESGETRRASASRRQLA